MGVILFFLLSLLIPIVIFFIARKKLGIGLKPVIVGAIIWIVMTQVLEKILHVIVFTQTPLMQYPYLFALYGGLAAGIFEEGGRYFAFKKLLPKYRQWKDGLAYGIGHGGIESIIIAILLVAFSLSISQMNGPELEQLKSQLQNTGMGDLLKAQSDTVYWLLAAAERIMALVVQIALSLLVLYSITSKKLRYLILAIGTHAFINFPAALYQSGTLSLPIVELILFVLALGGAIFIFRSRSLFKK